ncbi:MAG: type II toxin-antitoxin system prevent-host-death family antitoxin [Spirochaetaceae bacterium]|nr:type II toxin-antitoxin system prevent-host-death family antitoxin [Spirochaetaceae bacterium]
MKPCHVPPTNPVSAGPPPGRWHSSTRSKGRASRYLRIAETEEVVITRNGEPAGVLVGFHDEEDWLEYRLEHGLRFLARVESARKSISEGQGTPLEDLE